MYEYEGTLLKIIDGDTIDVIIDLGLDVGIRERLRLYGINAPEMHDKPAGQDAKDYITSILPPVGQIRALLIDTIKDQRGKYGRYLAKIYVPPNTTSVNDQMIDTGHAVPFMV